MSESYVKAILVGGLRDGELVELYRPLPETLTIPTMSVVDGKSVQGWLTYRQQPSAVAGCALYYYCFPPQTAPMPDPAPARSDSYDLDNIFTYHPPFGDQADRYTNLRGYVKNLAIQILVNTPSSREQALALTNLEQVLFWAHSAIARNEQPPAPPQETDA